MALQLFKIADVTVATPQASIEFANIPNGYTDLILQVCARGSNAAVNSPVLLQINSLTSGYTAKSVYGNGSTAASDNNPYSGENKLFAGEVTGSSATSNTFGTSTIYIPNYNSSNQKSVSSDSTTENNATTSYPVLAASLSNTTSAITNIKAFTYGTATWQANSTFTLYGVL